MQQILCSLGGCQRLLREAFASALTGGTGRIHDAGVRSYPVRLCDTTVSLQVREVGEGGPIYINLHENEQTAVQAAAATLQHHSGKLIELRSRGRRNVNFRSGLRPYAFDPNRIFTQAGIQGTLLRYQSSTAIAKAAVGHLRDAVLRLLEDPADALVVALHNNSGRYSIRHYEAGGTYTGDAQAVSTGRDYAPEDFFVVTRSSLFEALSRRGFNAVLQVEEPADDGSLSVWFQRQRRAYINVEAHHEHSQEQQRMLSAVAELALTM